MGSTPRQSRRKETRPEPWLLWSCRSLLSRSAARPTATWAEIQRKYSEHHRTATVPAHYGSLETRCRPLSILLRVHGLHPCQFAALLPVEEDLVLQVVAALSHLQNGHANIVQAKQTHICSILIVGDSAALRNFVADVSLPPADEGVAVRSEALIFPQHVWRQFTVVAVVFCFSTTEKTHDAGVGTRGLARRAGQQLFTLLRLRWSRLQVSARAVHSTTPAARSNQ